VLEQHVEQRIEVVALRNFTVGRLDGAGHARASRGVERGQAQCLLGGLLSLVVEVGGDVEQQIVAVRNHLGDTGVGAVGLVDDEDHRQVRGQRLAQHEPGLRQRALRGVDQQQHAVDHGQPTLDLTAEVGVSRGVDDVDDRDRSVPVVTVHRGVLGQDGDALFLLEVTGIHDAFGGVVAAVCQGTGLAQHRVDQGRFAMVNVSHDGDVAEKGGDIHVAQCGSLAGRSRKRETQTT
jgi:hypothetical protein